MNTAQTQNEKTDNRSLLSLDQVSAVEQSIKETELAPLNQDAVLSIEENLGKIFVALSDDDDKNGEADEEGKEDSILGPKNNHENNSILVQKPSSSGLTIARSHEDVLPENGFLDNVVGLNDYQTKTNSVANRVNGTDSNIGKQLSVAGI